MHFHQWELKCTSAVFTRFKPSTSVFFHWHCCTIVQQHEQKLQPAAHLSTNYNTALQSELHNGALLLLERLAESCNLRHAVVRLYDSATERK